MASLIPVAAKLSARAPKERHHLARPCPVVVPANAFPAKPLRPRLSPSTAKAMLGSFHPAVPQSGQDLQIYAPSPLPSVYISRGCTPHHGKVSLSNLLPYLCRFLGRQVACEFSFAGLRSPDANSTSSKLQPSLLCFLLGQPTILNHSCTCCGFLGRARRAPLSLPMPELHPRSTREEGATRRRPEARPHPLLHPQASPHTSSSTSSQLHSHHSSRTTSSSAVEASQRLSLATNETPHN